MKGKKRLKMAHKNAIAGYLYIAPFIIGFLFFFLLPVIESFRYSLSSMKMGAGRYELTYIGWENFRKVLLIDTKFNPGLLSSLGTMAIQVPVIVIFSFFVANILNQRFRGRALARMVFFLPVIITSGVILKMENADVLLQSSYQYVSGNAGNEMSDFQRLFDIGSFLQKYLGAGGVVSALISMATDHIYDIAISAGVQILIFLAGLQSIAPSVYEAARIEGASGWEVFWKVTLPMVSPLILVNALYSVIDSFTNASNEMMVMINDTMFGQVQFGAGSAMAWIYFLVIAILLAAAGGLLSRFVFYET
ncbi:MAG: sugar ABC transporter permease [Acetatifactor sp.]|nr:sugar ABC transporter permease [Acetatifactor sp.]